jgi:murein endopeptidase
MPFPQDLDALKLAGYRFDNHARCRGCNAEVEWWFTPKGKKMPFNLMEKFSSPAVAHLVTCPERDEFRSR